MFYGDSVDETRQLYFISWEKFQKKERLSPLENEIVQVILAHPEYQDLFNHPHLKQQSYHPELGQTNPFLHMGLHLAIREQISTNRPLGIQRIYQRMLQHFHEPLHVEHLMMEHLAEQLWRAQKDNLPPNEEHYLQALNALVPKTL